MKIAYIVEPTSIGGKLNGINSQAVTWAELLRERGCEVVYINSGESYKWDEFDIIHLFGSSETWFYSLAITLRKRNSNIVWSPICDNIDNPYIQRFKALLGSRKLQIFSYPFIRKQAYKQFKAIYVRSNYEKEYITKAYGVCAERIIKIPLAMSYNSSFEDDIKNVVKEDFCFHISAIYQERKNVLRLIEAAKKYKFNLVLAGSKGSPDQFATIEKAVEGVSNIQILGFLSEEEKISYYKRAKVFALPSIMEGVGIVALDAAHFGCDVVITDVGGPKEYYKDFAYPVNPFDVDSIGLAVRRAMTESKQPYLKEWVDEMYSQNRIADLLLSSYQDVIRM